MTAQEYQTLRVARAELQALSHSHGRETAIKLLSTFDVTRLCDLQFSRMYELIARVRAAARLPKPPEKKPVNDYQFFFVASQKRLADGTPYMRERFTTEKEAITCANLWAGKSEHGGKYIVFNVVAVGEAQRAEPPVKYRKIRAKRVRASKRK